VTAEKEELQGKIFVALNQKCQEANFVRKENQQDATI